ncbi:hypothetical protein GC096_30690 [Paenibacillus sp. LMG 31461]|uniref:Right handed beta helix domain-containing protein n=1 Tax=Paenibacillus plantarum TaxID=2654975 RepID=A0ABX1XIM7_9BACL|nr:right-handed parallel beta-helix repeat-containing protein [Paenibacillus plantarum]NOU68398.1 hypothetical protein [Paenibacillus plantarum]
MGWSKPSSGTQLDVKKQFGAKGDGSTDDTAALQACLDSLVNGTSIFIPDGTYITTGLKMYNKSHISVVSNGATLKLKANSNADVFLLEQCPYLSISGLNIDGNKGNQSSIVTGLKLKASYFTNILNCRVTNVKGDGVAIIGYYDGTLFRGNDEIHLNHCFVQSNTRHGLSVDSVADLNVTTCNIEFNSGNGILLTNTTDIASGNANLIDSQILSNDGYGIEVTEGSSRLIIAKNHIRNNGKNGIRYVGGKQYIFTENNIHLNGRINEYSAAIIVGYNRRGLIANNLITCTDFSPTQGYGIEAFSVNGLRIFNNVIEDNLQPGVMIDPDCLDVKIRDNIGVVDAV